MVYTLPLQATSKTSVAISAQKTAISVNKFMIVLLQISFQFTVMNLLVDLADFSYLKLTIKVVTYT